MFLTLKFKDKILILNLLFLSFIETLIFEPGFELMFLQNFYVLIKKTIEKEEDIKSRGWVLTNKARVGESSKEEEKERINNKNIIINIIIIMIIIIFSKYTKIYLRPSHQHHSKLK